MLVGCDSILRAIETRLDNPACAVTVAILFGKPGRGKTSTGEMLGRTRGDWFQEINASSERRGTELREALNRFVSDGHQHALRRRLAWQTQRGERDMAMGERKPVISVTTPIGVLLLDEADGLGAIGQATVASFVAELEDDGIRNGWRVCLVIACNVMGALHDSLLSRAHVLAEMPRPKTSTLVAAARTWAGPALPAERLARFTDGQLETLAVRADGDFRAMRQLVMLAAWGGGGTPASSTEPAAPAAPAEPTAPAELAAQAAPAEPSPCTEMTLAAGPVRCPRDLSQLLLTGRNAYDLGIWRRVWEQGHRGDVVAQWVEQASFSSATPADWRLRLVRFRGELIHRTGPDTLLQLIGSFARTMTDLPHARRF